MKASQLQLALVLACVITNLPAQTTPASKVPPPGPLLKDHAPDFSQWVVTTTFKDDKPGASGSTGQPVAPPPPPQIVTIVKTGNVRHVTFQSGDSKESETWCKGAYQVITAPGWSEPVLSTGTYAHDAGRLDFSHGDFSGFEWINGHNFTEIRKIEGRSCLVFQDRISSLGSKSGDAKIPATAFIDLETRLPVSLQLGPCTTTYQFGSPPTEALKLPPELEAVIDVWARKIQALSRPPTTP